MHHKRRVAIQSISDSIFTFLAAYFLGNMRDPGKLHSVVESRLNPGTCPVCKRLLSDQPSATPVRKRLGRFLEHIRLQPVLAASRSGSVGIRVEEDGDHGGIGAKIQWLSTVMYDPGCQWEGRPTIVMRLRTWLRCLGGGCGHHKGLAPLDSYN